MYQGTGAGILRGQGRQHLGAAIVFAGYGLALSVGTPLMLYTSLRLYGKLCTQKLLLFSVHSCQELGGSQGDTPQVSRCPFTELQCPP